MILGIHATNTTLAHTITKAFTDGSLVKEERQVLTGPGSLKTKQVIIMLYCSLVFKSVGAT